ncbi:MAG TPA: MATE family efflux transporter, partial [Burkholderiales bacterium]|nr:MATE family efflux transporter [Burkholderiales bacterium]
VFLWAGLVGAFNVVAFALAGHGIIALLTSIPEVRAAAGDWVIWPIVMPIVSVWAFTYDGVYLAATRTTIMRNTVIASFGAFLILLYALTPLYGNMGIWIAITVFLGMRGLLLHVFFPRVLRAIPAQAQPDRITLR